MIKYKNTLYKSLVAILFLYFITQSLYFAVNIKSGFFPDEGTHLSLIKVYNQTGSIFLNYHKLDADLGTTSQNPFLYHWALGKILNLNYIDIDEILFLRIINIIISLIGLVFFFKLTKLFTKNKFISLLALVLMSNILYFSFLSAGINYDNLVIAISTASLYYLFKYVNHNKIACLCLWLIFISLGSLTKVSFLPLALISTVILIVDQKNNLKHLKTNFVQFLKENKPANYFIFLFSVFLFLSIFLFYGRNFILYKKLVPQCENLYSKEQCLRENYFYKRDNLLKKENINKERIDLFNYYFFWRETIVSKVFGLENHRGLLLKPVNKHLANFIFFIYLVLIVFLIKFYKRDKNIKYAMTIAFGYSLFLLFYFNYPTYLILGDKHLAIHGRYLFPVISLFVVSFSYLLLNFVNKKKQIILFVFFALIFIYLGFPSFFLNNKSACLLKKGVDNNAIYDKELGVNIFVCK